jgi:hypothetical protein
MRRVTRFLARLYPSTWRKRYGAEFDALLEDASPKPRDTFDILWGAFKMQTTTWTFLRIMLACALTGLLASLTISITLPVTYRSEAVLHVSPEVIPEAMPENGSGIDNPPRMSRAMWDSIMKLTKSALSPNSLVSIIQRRGLYMNERRRLPFDDVVEMMHKSVSVRPILDPRSNRAGTRFAVQFDYPDGQAAQQVTSDLASRFMEGNGNPEINSQVRLDLLEGASLPMRPSRVNQASIAAAVGLFTGVLAGLALALVIRSRRRLAV